MLALRPWEKKNIPVKLAAPLEKRCWQREQAQQDLAAEYLIPAAVGGYDDRNHRPGPPGMWLEPSESHELSDGSLRFVPDTCREG